jgi:elongation factor P
MATTSDVSVGTFIRYNGELCVITEWQHRTPGNLRAFYQAKMRNVKNGKSAENRYRSGEEIEVVRVEMRPLMFSYKEGNNLVCMDNETYEQVYIDEVLFGDGVRFMKESMEIYAAFEGDAVIYAEPPKNVELEITYTEPGVKGDTATKTLKPATVETGATVSIPLFINIGEKVKIDTRTGEYLERVK